MSKPPFCPTAAVSDAVSCQKEQIDAQRTHVQAKTSQTEQRLCFQKRFHDYVKNTYVGLHSSLTRQTNRVHFCCKEDFERSRVRATNEGRGGSSASRSRLDIA
eukprot:5099242-Amphidinium_carterae.1